MFLLTPSVFVWDLIILMMLVGSAAIAMLCLLRIRRRCGGRMSRAVARLILILSCISFFVVVYGSFIEPQIIVVTKNTVPFPVRSPLTVALISDIHVGPYKDEEFTKRIVRKVNALLPDIVLIAGDFVLGEDVTPDQLKALAPLKDLQPTIGTYAVLGNHDYSEHRTILGISSSGNDRSEYLTAALQSLNVRVLANEFDIVTVGAEKIAIAGVRDLRVSRADLDAALREIPPDLPIILLSHNPDIVQDTLSAKAELIATGHTHGGQVRLPIIGPLVRVPTRLGNAFDQCTFVVDENSTLSITRGIGECGPRARLFAWPEVMELRLSSDASS